MCNKEYEELDLITKLRVYQAIKRLNQTQLGEKLKVSQPVVSRVLKGTHKPSFELQQKINNLINGH
ncbi:helix-turn-helix transcriptional regulator [Neobacillus drentensis]|uniref:helix-turn-helix transcriptional regulator n=1 Tax=Neobacillus drentensis TaxID=220684 RepID=UPI003001D897